MNQEQETAMYDQPDQPECRSCLIPGAPPHEPSRRCQHNGTVAHCTCRACWG